MSKKKLLKKQLKMERSQRELFEKMVLDFALIGDGAKYFNFFHKNKLLGSMQVINEQLDNYSGSANKSDLKYRII